MGGPEVIAELNTFIDRPDWVKIWLQSCRLSTAPADVVTRDKTTGNEAANAQYAGGGLDVAAYVYMMTKNPAYAAKAMGRIVTPPAPCRWRRRTRRERRAWRRTRRRRARNGERRSIWMGRMC